MDEPQKRVVVVGAGFGGLALVKGLKDSGVAITLIDRTNHNLFQPLLYQVATAALAPSDIAVPVRGIFGDRPDVTVLLGEVTGIDQERRLVLVDRGRDVPFDLLVIATGSVYTWFGHDDWAAHSYALKTLDEALRLRAALLNAFERAEGSDDASEVARLLTFVIVGGGATGVELAGAVAELAQASLAKDFRHIRPGSARVVLCEGGPRLLAGFPPALSDYARRKLAAMKVEVLTGKQVESVDADGITVGDIRIRSATVLWCAGTVSTPAADWLCVDKGKHSGVPTAPDCSVIGLPGVFAIGDVASMTSADAKPLPGVGAVAKQQGAYVAAVIAAQLSGRSPPPPFRYKDAGQLAMVGRSAAVADLGRITFTGFVAWVLWNAIHLLFLIGGRNRLVVYLNWAWAWFTYGRGARLITRADRSR